MRAMCVVLALCAAAAVFPAAASAKTWKGKTGQKRAVVVRTGDDGVVNRVQIGWRARCANGNYKSSTVFRQPLDSATTTAFADAGDYRGHPKGYTARIWVRVAGTLDDGSWRGTFRVRVRVKKNGKVIDTCRLKGLRWRASPVS
jgi:hypothetical protein